MGDHMGFLINSDQCSVVGEQSTIGKKMHRITGLAEDVRTHDWRLGEPGGIERALMPCVLFGVCRSSLARVIAFNNAAPPIIDGRAMPPTVMPAIVPSPAMPTVLAAKVPMMSSPIKSCIRL